MNILLNSIKPHSNFWIEFLGTKCYWIIFWIEYYGTNWYWIFFWVELHCEMNEWIVYWIEIFNFWRKKIPFLVNFGHYLGTFGHFSDSTSINESLTIELNRLLNWITKVYFELNNSLNWILGKQYWIKNWIESFLNCSYCRVEKVRVL